MAAAAPYVPEEVTSTIASSSTLEYSFLDRLKMAMYPKFIPLKYDYVANAAVLIARIKARDVSAKTDLNNLIEVLVNDKTNLHRENDLKKICELILLPEDFTEISKLAIDLFSAADEVEVSSITTKLEKLYLKYAKLLNLQYGITHNIMALFFAEYCCKTAQEEAIAIFFKSKLLTNKNTIQRYSLDYATVEIKSKSCEMNSVATEDNYERIRQIIWTGSLREQKKLFLSTQNWFENFANQQTPVEDLIYYASSFALLYYYGIGTSQDIKEAGKYFAIAIREEIILPDAKKALYRETIALQLNELRAIISELSLNQFEEIAVIEIYKNFLDKAQLQKIAELSNIIQNLNYYSLFDNDPTSERNKAISDLDAIYQENLATAKKYNLDSEMVSWFFADMGCDTAQYDSAKKDGGLGAITENIKMGKSFLIAAYLQANPKAIDYDPKKYYAEDELIFKLPLYSQLEFHYKNIFNDAKVTADYLITNSTTIFNNPAEAASILIKAIGLIFNNHNKQIPPLNKLHKNNLVSLQAALESFIASYSKVPSGSIAALIDGIFTSSDYKRIASDKNLNLLLKVLQNYNLNLVVTADTAASHFDNARCNYLAALFANLANLDNLDAILQYYEILNKFDKNALKDAKPLRLSS